MTNKPFNPDLPTLRDQFAMSALTGLVASGRDTFSRAATDAYELADLMMKVRNGEEVTDDNSVPW